MILRYRIITLVCLIIFESLYTCLPNLFYSTNDFYDWIPRRAYLKVLINLIPESRFIEKRRYFQLIFLFWKHILILNSWFIVLFQRGTTSFPFSIIHADLLQYAPSCLPHIPLGFLWVISHFSSLKLLQLLSLRTFLKQKKPPN